MIQGFILPDKSAVDSINDAVRAAHESRGVAPYWLPGGVEIFSGDHAGQWIIPFSDDVTRTKIMRRGLRVDDFPETAQLVAQLGGLNARVFIDPADLIDPNAPDE